MLLTILALVDKLLAIIGAWLPWQLKRSDESKKKREEAQIEMLDAEFKGDFSQWKRARSKRNNA